MLVIEHMHELPKANAHIRVFINVHMHTFMHTHTYAYTLTHTATFGHTCKNMSLTFDIVLK